MTRPNALVVVSVLAFLVAGCASYLAYNFIKKQVGQKAQGIAILMAATDIPVGTKLEATHFKVATLPKEAVASGCLTDATKASGRIVVRPMNAGDIVTEAKLLPQDGAAKAGIMTYMVPAGHRAVTVAVNEVAGVAGFITPGSRVDIVLTTPKPGGDPNREEHISKIILQNVPVLASGQFTEQKDGKPVNVPTVTVDLSPEDAEKVIVGLGARRGSLQLLLRNAVDVERVVTSGSTVAKALGAADPLPIAPRKATRVKVVQFKPTPPPVVAKVSVEVIKGGVKTTREFSTGD